MLDFQPSPLPASAQAQRARIRAFLSGHDFTPSASRANSWSVPSHAFSRALGAAGFIGMSWPQQYGGAGATLLERYVVQEELLAAGAPVGLHWIADRQSGALLLRFGTEAQRQQYLPAMARGELYTCIGMSEPEAGSDLAALRCRATEAPGGWRVNGQKLWTSNAQFAGLMIALVRTSTEAERHAGLTQLLLDLTTPGITIRPIRDLTGTETFNEVFFDDVFVPESAVLGKPGDGWTQVMAELALERSGPERYLSSFALLRELLRAMGPRPDPVIAGLLGTALAELFTLRSMSLAVMARLEAGLDASVQAAMVKDLGNHFEQELPRLVQAALPGLPEPEAHPDLTQTLALLLQTAPSFSLRGGTREILRGIIARALGLR